MPHLTFRLLESRYQGQTNGIIPERLDRDPRIDPTIVSENHHRNPDASGLYGHCGICPKAVFL
jgi:hypothetical protein